MKTTSDAPWPMAMLLVAMLGCGSSSGSPSRPGVDTAAPTVRFTSPIDGAVGMAVITASFSEAMDPSTITQATFSVGGQGVPRVPGTVVYNPSLDMARFMPTGALASNTVYTATISTGARDVAGNAMVSNVVWSFTTSARTSFELSPAAR